MYMLAVHAVFTIDADSSFSNIYKVAFTAMSCSKIIQRIFSFWQGVPRAYAFCLVLRAMRWNFMPLGKKYPYQGLPFGECSGQEPRVLDYAEITISSATCTLSS